MQLDAARQRLCRKHLAWAVARGLAWAHRGAADESDTVGAALLGLVKAGVSYRGSLPRIAVPFRAWARIWVDGECKGELRGWGRFRGQHRVAEWLDEVPAPGDDSTEASPALASAWAMLGARDREVLDRRVIQGLTYAEVGEAVGLSPSGVHAAERRALAALRAALSEEKDER